MSKCGVNEVDSLYNNVSSLHAHGTQSRIMLIRYIYLYIYISVCEIHLFIVEMFAHFGDAFKARAEMTRKTGHLIC